MLERPVREIRMLRARRRWRDERKRESRPEPSYQRRSGTIPLSPVAAAVANAFFDATGVRIFEAPMTPARVRGVLKAAGK
jgi:hypothetical protein